MPSDSSLSLPPPPLHINGSGDCADSWSLPVGIPPHPQLRLYCYLECIMLPCPQHGCFLILLTVFLSEVYVLAGLGFQCGWAMDGLLLPFRTMGSPCCTLSQISQLVPLFTFLHQALQKLAISWRTYHLYNFQSIIIQG